MKKIMIGLVFLLSFFSMLSIGSASCRREQPDLSKWKLVREDLTFESVDGKEPDGNENTLYECCRDITTDFNEGNGMWTTHCDQYTKIDNEQDPGNSGVCPKPTDSNWKYVKHENNFFFDNSKESNGVKIVCCKEGKMGTQDIWGCDYYDYLLDEPNNPDNPNNPNSPDNPSTPNIPNTPDEPNIKIEDASIGGLCNKSSFRKPMKFLGTLVTFFKYIVPIAIILFGMMDLYKAVTGAKDDEMKKAFKQIGVRVIAGVFIFLLPGIVQFILNMVNEWSDYKNDWCCCTDCLLNPDCNVDSCSSNSCHIEGMNN